MRYPANADIQNPGANRLISPIHGRSATANLTAAIGGVVRTLVFLGIGQSNRVGEGLAGALDTAFPPDTFQVARTGSFSGGLEGEIVPAVSPLDNYEFDPDFIAGLDLGFARLFRAANAGVNILLIPCAKGATGFSTNDWNPGDGLAEDAVARVNALFAANPSFEMGGILWHGGEADVSQWQTLIGKHDALRAHLIASCPAVTAETPWLVGGFVDTNQQINKVMERVPSVIPFSAFSSSLGLVDKGDTIHFDGPSSVTLGERYYASLLNAAANNAVPQVDVFDLTTTPLNYGGGGVVTPIAGGFTFPVTATRRLLWGPKPNSIFMSTPYIARMTLLTDFTGSVGVRIATNTALSSSIVLNETVSVTADVPQDIVLPFFSGEVHEAGAYFGLIPAQNGTLTVTSMSIDRQVP